MGLYHMCRCGAVIPQGIPLCSACAELYAGSGSRHMEYNRNRRNKQAAAFYICGDWRKVRDYALKLYDGLDIYAYYVQHTIATADMVHHIVEIEEDWTRRLDITNLLPLSNTNHGIISALYAKDDATKRATQQQLRQLIAVHWERQGGIENVLKGCD